MAAALKNGPEAGLAFPQPLLCGPALRNILGRPQQAPRLAVFLEDDFALVMHIAHRTVGPDEAADQIIRLHSCQGRVERLSHPRLIFRVYTLHHQYQRRGEFMRVKPKDAINFLGPDYFAGFQIPFPIPQMGQPLGLGQPGLALPELFLRPFPGRNIVSPEAGHIKPGDNVNILFEDRIFNLHFAIKLPAFRPADSLQDYCVIFRQK